VIVRTTDTLQRNVEQNAADGHPGTLFAVFAREPVPVQRRIAATVVGSGWTLLEVRADPPTLEDLFVRLVAPAERAAAAS